MSEQVVQRVCATLQCRRRTGLARTKVVTCGLILDVDLCPEHLAEEEAGLHRVFRERFGTDFVDPERN